MSALPAGPAACFDMDGVLVDSEEVKIKAWLTAVTEVCRPSPALAADLDRYNRGHRGVPRVGKFRYVIEFLTAAGCTLPDRTLEALLARYAALLEPLVAAAPAARRNSCAAGQVRSRWRPALRSQRRRGTSLACASARWATYRPIPPPKRTPSGNWPGRPVARPFSPGTRPATRRPARAASVPFVGIGNNVPPSRQAMLDHAGTLSGLLGREEQIAAAVLKLAISPQGR